MEPFDQSVEHVRADMADDHPRDKSALAIVVERNQELLESLDHAVVVLTKRVRPVSRQVGAEVDPRSIRDDEMKKAHDLSSTMVQMISSQNERLRGILNKVNSITENLEI